MAPGPGLKIEIVEKRFAGAVPLFADLRMEIAPASIVALIGPSGVVKSTLLRLIAGIDQSFAGSVLVGGMPSAASPPPGFVFQDPRLLPWLTAAQNIMAADPAIDRAKAVAELARVGLYDAADLFPHQLSGGMQRRVALARAFSVNASLLLLDEPFVSLDRELVEEMQQLFLRLVQETRATVLFVSHLREDAARLADRTVLLDARPAKIVADIEFPIRPVERDETTILRYRQQLDVVSQNKA